MPEPFFHLVPSRSFLGVVLALATLAAPVARAGDLDPICSKYVEDRGYQKFYNTRSGTRAAGDTIYWETRVLPDFERISQDPKFQTEAILNSKFKTMLSSYGLRENEISSANQDRIISNCHTNPQMEGCLAMQTYCVSNYVKTQWPKARDSFYGCLDAKNRNNGCGKDFQTADGIARNLGVLNQFQTKIGEIDGNLRKLPLVPEYLSDIQSTFEDFSANVQAKLALGKKKLEDLKKEESAASDGRFQAANRQAGALGDACRAFSACKGYLERQGHHDTKQLLNQISSCDVSIKYAGSSAQFDSTVNTLKDIQSAAQKKALADLSHETFDEALGSSARQYLDLYARVNGGMPSESTFCQRFGKCGDPILHAAYAETKAQSASLAPVDFGAEMAAFNTKVRALNAACTKAKDGGQNPNEAIDTAHRQMLYGSMLGGLLIVDKFSDKVGKFDPANCLEKGVGMKELDPKSDGADVKGALNEMVGIIADKGKELTHQQSDLLDPKDPTTGIQYFLENDPLVLRELIRKTNSPEQAMLLCGAIEKIYAKEAKRRFWSKTFTYLTIAGAIVATIMTAGAATPALVASISFGLGTAALGLGTYNSITNMIHLDSDQKHLERSNATGSFDRDLSGSLITQDRQEFKGEAIGLGLQFVPIVGKSLGGVVGKTVIKPLLQSRLFTLLSETPVWKGAGEATATLTKPVSALMTSLKAGSAKAGDLTAALISRVSPTTSKIAVATFGAITKDMGPDAAMIFTANALTHPKPFSKDGMLEMLEAFVKARGMAALGNAGGKIYAKLKTGGFEAITANRLVEIPTTKEFKDPVKIETTLAPNGDKLLTVVPTSEMKVHAESKNWNADDYAERKHMAEQVLGEDKGALSVKKADGVYQAHLVGDPNHGYGTYTKTELLQKAKILRDAGFDTHEIDGLMRNGVAGSETPRTLTYEEAVKTYKAGGFTNEELSDWVKKPEAEYVAKLEQIAADRESFRDKPGFTSAFKRATQAYDDLQGAGYFSQKTQEAKALFQQKVPNSKKLDELKIAKSTPVEMKPVVAESIKDATEPLPKPPELANVNIGKELDYQIYRNKPETYSQVHKELVEVQTNAEKVTTPENPVNMAGIQKSLETELGKIQSSKTELTGAIENYDKLDRLKGSMKDDEKKAFETLAAKNKTRTEILADLKKREDVLVAQQKRIGELQSQWKSGVLKDPAIYVNGLPPGKSGRVLLALEESAGGAVSLSTDQTERLLNTMEKSFKDGKYKFDSISEKERADQALFVIATSGKADIRYFPELKARLESLSPGMKWPVPADSKYIEPTIEKELVRAHAQAELGRPLTDDEATALYKAHLQGRFELGKDGVTKAEKDTKNYTQSQLFYKKSDLRKVFTPEETIKLLRGGVAGDGEPLTAYTDASKTFPKNPKDIPAWRADAQAKIAAELREKLRNSGLSPAQTEQAAKSASGSVVRNLEKKVDRSNAAEGSRIKAENSDPSRRLAKTSEILRSGKDSELGKNISITASASSESSKVPKNIADNLAEWVDAVKKRGLSEVKKIPGYRDHVLNGERSGQRAISLNDGYRAIYVINEKGGIEIVKVTKHDYSVK